MSGIGRLIEGMNIQLHSQETKEKLFTKQVNRVVLKIKEPESGV